jgi:hypothetical protein
LEGRPVDGFDSWARPRFLARIYVFSHIFFDKKM